MHPEKNISLFNNHVIILLLIVCTFVPSSKSNAETKEIKGALEALRPLFAMPNNGIDFFSPIESKPDVWGDFLGGRQEYINTYAITPDSRFYFNLGSRTNTKLMNPIRFNADDLSVGIKGTEWQYSIESDFLSFRDHDVFEVINVFEQKSALEQIARKHFMNGYGSLFIPYGDNNQEISFGDLTDGFSQFFDFIIGGLHKKKAGGATVLFGKFPLVDHAGVGYLSLSFDNLMVSKDIEVSFDFTLGHAVNAKVNFEALLHYWFPEKSDFKLLSLLSSGLGLSFLATNGLQVKYDVTEFIDLEMMIKNQEFFSAGHLGRAIDPIVSFGRARFKKLDYFWKGLDLISGLDALLAVGPNIKSLCSVNLGINKHHRINGKFSSAGRAWLAPPQITDITIGGALDYKYTYRNDEMDGSFILLKFGKEIGKDNLVKFYIGSLVKSVELKNDYMNESYHVAGSINLVESLFLALFDQDSKHDVSEANNNQADKQKNGDYLFYPVFPGTVRLIPADFFKTNDFVQTYFSDFGLEFAWTVCEDDLVVVSPFLRFAVDHMFSIDDHNYILAGLNMAEYSSDYVPFRKHPEAEFAVSYVRGRRHSAKGLQQLLRDTRLLNDRTGFPNGLPEQLIMKFLENNHAGYSRVGVALRSNYAGFILEKKTGKLLVRAEPQIDIGEEKIIGYSLKVTGIVNNSMVRGKFGYKYTDLGIPDDDGYYDLSLLNAEFDVTQKIDIFKGFYLKISGTFKNSPGERTEQGWLFSGQYAF